MSYQISNFTDNDDIKTLDQQGPFSIIEYQRDLSVTPETKSQGLFHQIQEEVTFCGLLHEAYA